MTHTRRIRRLWLIPLAILAAAPVLLLTKGCASTLPNRDPTGQPFPQVVGQSLEKERTPLPDALAGEPAVILIGYKQSSQFDIDRWAMGLIQAEVEATLVELPTIPGLVPSFASGWIDDGMRSGIPREEWGSVVTLYGDDAQPVAAMTGTEEGQLARVLVIDAQGEIVWFDDEGYSPRKALAVADLVRRINGAD